jgi:hypothetical protein
MRGQQLLLLSWLAAASITITASIQSLPTVDLGYEIHQAISFNVIYFPFSLHDQPVTDSHISLLDKPTIFPISGTLSLHWAIYALRHQSHR